MPAMTVPHDPGKHAAKSDSASDQSVLRSTNAGDLPLIIRNFRSSDLPACRKLYVQGLLGGKLAENDSGLDIDDIESAYMRPPGNHFWVAETVPDAEQKK